MSKRVFVAGHTGLVGSALRKRLVEQDVELIVKSKKELDLTCQESVTRFFKSERITEVYLAAARVGGIWANNKFPSEFLYENVMIEMNVINAAFKAGVENLLFLGSSCIYPRLAEQPITEESLLSGPLESTNEAYAIAKITGLKLCEYYNKQFGMNFFSVMPTNLYGPGDTYHVTDSHVIPSLVLRFHEAKESGSSSATIWGTGQSLREFMFVEDLADACIFLTNLPREELNETMGSVRHLNVGTGDEFSIKTLAALIQDVVGFDGDLIFDSSKPEGTPRKLLDSSRLTQLGWTSTIRIEDGLKLTYADFLESSFNCP